MLVSLTTVSTVVLLDYYDSCVLLDSSFTICSVVFAAGLAQQAQLTMGRRYVNVARERSSVYCGHV